MDEQERNKALREFIIAYIKRYMYETEFMSHVVEQTSYAFKNAGQIVKQFIKVRDDLKMILDYNFTEEEVQLVNPAGLDTSEDAK